MSVFLDFLRRIFCCDDEFRDGDYKTSYRKPSLQSASYDTSARSSSRRSYNDLLPQPDTTKIYYDEYYPNLSSITKSTTKEPDAVSFQSKYMDKPLKRTSELSQSLSASPKLPQSSAKQTSSSSNPSLSSSKPYLPFTNSAIYSSKPSSLPPKVTSSTTQSSSFSKPPSSSTKSSVSSTGAPISSSTSSSSLTKLAIPSSITSASSPKPSSASPNSVTYSSKPSSSPPKAASSFTQSSSFSKPPSSSSKPFLSSTGAPSSSSTSSSSLTKLAVPSSSPKSSSSSLRQSLSSPEAPPYTYDQPLSSVKSPACAFKQSPFSKASPSSSDLPQSSSGLPPSSLKAPPLSKPTLTALPFDSKHQRKKANYTWVQTGPSPIYKIPKDIEDLIKKDIVPNVLKKSLSPSTYKDYFAALLYAEDFYIEKWSEFQLFNVTVELHEAAIYNKSFKNKYLQKSDEKDDKVFVAFEIDSVPEKRPFLLSRDFVYARPVSRKAKQYEGLVYRVVKSNILLVEFEEDFYFQHHPDHKYDISLSFNRVCLKRAHQAIAAASGPIFQDYLFPDCSSRKNVPESASLPYSSYKLDSDEISAVLRILSFRGSPPYLVMGPLSVTGKQLSKTGTVVREAILEIYLTSPKSRILICAPTNRTCDVLMESLKKIPEADMFRANAAFREIDGVPADILPLCLYKRECFFCPPFEKLKQFRVIFSTFVSSFRLHDEGITAGHFSHIFLVDASSTIEPETMIPLSNLANENTSVIVTGAPGNRSHWVRSDIARKNGLRVSYFERLCENSTYRSFDPIFVSTLNEQESDKTFSFL